MELTFVCAEVEWIQRLKSIYSRLMEMSKSNILRPLRCSIQQSVINLAKNKSEKSTQSVFIVMLLYSFGEPFAIAVIKIWIQPIFFFYFLTKTIQCNICALNFQIKLNVLNCKNVLQFYTFPAIYIKFSLCEL